MTNITIAIDAMGGDHGPSYVVPAALMSLAKKPDLSIILVGDRQIINQYLVKHHAKENARLTVHHTTQTVEMAESPVTAMRNKKDSSMRVALDLVKTGQASACVSAGNTGALIAIARFVLKTLPGIDRPALVRAFPTIKPGQYVRVLDLGANVDSTPLHLLQFSIMGSILAQAVDGNEAPRVSLLNIGEEDIKGNEVVKQAAELVKQQKGINYIGYIEGDKIYKGTTDVIVCDGFIGNVALKVTEGTIKVLVNMLREAFFRNWYTKLAGLAALRVLKGIRKRVDPDINNGASLLGLQGIVIKSHGAANVVGITNAIRQAVLEVHQDVPSKIREQVTAQLEERAKE